MSRNFLTSLNLNKNELLNAAIQSLSTPPSNPVAGQIYFDTDTTQLTLWDGTAWVSLAVGGTVQEAIDALTTDDIEEGLTNLYFTDGRAKDSAAALLTTATLSNITITGTGSGGLTITAENGVADSTTDDLDEGTTNLYFTNQRALDATSAAYDPAGSAATAETNAKAYTDDLIGDATVDGTAGNTVTDRIATAVSDLVDGAPALLDTLNELAAAINDDASFSTTITTSIGEKVAKAGDTMTGALTLHADPSSNLHAATKQYVDTEIADAFTAFKYAANNTSLTPVSGSVTWAVTHNLGSTDVLVQVKDVTTKATVEVDVVITDANTVTLSWVASSTVAADSYRVVVIG